MYTSCLAELMQDGATMISYNKDITSLQNPLIKNCVKLRDRRGRDHSGTFLIEGYRELSRAVTGKIKVRTLFICSDMFLGSNESTLIASIVHENPDLVVCRCTESVFQKISYRDRPDGLLAIAEQMKLEWPDIEAAIEGKENPLIVVAEAIEKPGNLGTILRSSDAAGADALIVCDRCTDIHNPNVVRASVGTLFTVPVIEVSGSEALAWLHKRGFSVLAATPSAEKEYTEVDMQCPVAIAVGTEQLGLSKLWMDECDLQVRLPMSGVADSLNVAMATTLLLYEALRQRK